MPPATDHPPTGPARVARARGRRWAAAVVTAVAVLALVGCGSATAAHPKAPDRTTDYLPGVAADVYLPSPRPARAPVVVLFPGGGWTTSHREGMRPLAATLASSGIVAVDATYRVADVGAHFPTPVQDMVCALGFAVAQAKGAGIAPTGVVVVGHSAGAHLGSLAALATDHFRGPCRWQPPRVDGFVGLAGPYDVRQYAIIAAKLFGSLPVQDPTLWEQADPLRWAAARTDRPRVVLVHGDHDTTVPVSSSRDFAAALRADGFTVTLDVVRGADHSAVYAPAVAAGPVEDLVRSLPGSPPPGP
jgi:acetyl esterase/lipase